jgi:hypothetical protein
MHVTVLQVVAQQAIAMPQPIRPSDLKQQPTHMQMSIHAKREAYEDDPKKLQEVHKAGGYKNDLWKARYCEEALSIGGFSFSLI